jgi:hypothetical protein
MIELAEQVFLGADGVRRISSWRKELALAPFASSHGRNIPLIFQDDELALSHADSLSQFQGLYQCNDAGRVRARQLSKPPFHALSRKAGF